MKKIILCLGVVVLSSCASQKIQEIRTPAQTSNIGTFSTEQDKIDAEQCKKIHGQFVLATKKSLKSEYMKIIESIAEDQHEMFPHMSIQDLKKGLQESLEKEADCMMIRAFSRWQTDDNGQEIIVGTRSYLMALRHSYNKHGQSDETVLVNANLESWDQNIETNPNYQFSFSKVPVAKVAAPLPASGAELWKRKDLAAVNAWSTLILLKALSMNVYKNSENTKIAPLDNSKEGILSLARKLDEVFTNTYLGTRLKPRDNAITEIFNSISVGETAGQFAERIYLLYNFNLK